MNLLIGLHGESRAGKDSVARFMVEDFGFVQRNMATPIRNILLDLNPIIKTDDGNLMSMQELFMVAGENWDTVKAMSRDSVDYMIRLGQSCRDHINKEVWLNTAINNPPRRLVIADVRQPNEYDAIVKKGGQVWKVDRPGTEARGMDSLLQGYHFHNRIENRGSLADLRGIVQASISSLINGSYVQHVAQEGKLCFCGDYSRYNNGTCGPRGCYNVPA